jgi:galactose-1-phosphate uridylyltransferase
MARIEFRTEQQESVFHSPLENMQEVTQNLEIRFDPLTGRQSVFNSALEGKAKTAFPDTDFDYLEQRAKKTKKQCFLCPTDWKKYTPKYPEELVPTGILEKGQAALFPNLFPIAPYHSMIRVGDKHLRTLDDFPPDLLADAFEIALEFVRLCYAYDPGMRYATMNANYQLPAGASVIHPHFQIMSSPLASTHNDLILQKSAEYWEHNSTNYWQDLVSTEKELGQRWIGRTGQAHWLTAFSPMGQNEIMVVWPQRHSFMPWTREDVRDLAAGMSHVLKVWHEMKLSSFNFSCFSAPLDEDSPYFSCVMRLVNRQNVVPDHRTDDYFLQKLMHNDMIINRPERLAQWMGEGFPST